MINTSEKNWEKTLFPGMFEMSLFSLVFQKSRHILHNLLNTVVEHLNFMEGLKMG